MTVKFGPNDADYVHGFRPEWERDGLTPFRWTTFQSSVRLPLRLRGGSFRLAARVRRHFVEPAQVRLRVEEQTCATFDLAADPSVAYRVVTFDLPALRGVHPFQIDIDARSENPRPLGLAVDWMEIERVSGRVLLDLATCLRLALMVGIIFAVTRFCGGSRRLAVAAAGALAACAAAGAHVDALALERIVREGVRPFALVALVAGAAARRWTAGPYVAIATLLAAALRLVLLLHPQFYYNDVRVHALFEWQLVRRGLGLFLEDFVANQYRYSLGLQRVGDHWYAFPYPPLFYVLARGFFALAVTRADLLHTASIAVSTCAAAVNALEALVVFAIARILTRQPGAAALAAFAHALLPLFLKRLSLAYFPATVGHAVDAVIVLYILHRYTRLAEKRSLAGLALLVALSLLVYTQALLNFSVLLPLFLTFEWLTRERQQRRLAAFLALAFVAGGVLGVAAFYGRYASMVLEMRRNAAPQQESILLEQLAKRQQDVTVPDDEIDPYVGPRLDLWRGLRKAVWRGYVFYGPFLVVALAGVVIVVRGTEGWARRFVIAWGLTYVLLNLASGGLPGPNLVRYNKDLEVVAPLACTALAVVGTTLSRAAKPLGVLFSASYAWFALARALEALTARFTLTR